MVLCPGRSHAEHALLRLGCGHQAQVVSRGSFQVVGLFFLDPAHAVEPLHAGRRLPAGEQPHRLVVVRLRLASNVLQLAGGELGVIFEHPQEVTCLYAGMLATVAHEDDALAFLLR